MCRCTSLRFAFNGSIRVTTLGDRLASNAGALLLRDLDDPLGVTSWHSHKLRDPCEARGGRHDMLEFLSIQIPLMAIGRLNQVDA